MSYYIRKAGSKSKYAYAGPLLDKTGASDLKGATFDTHQAAQLVVNAIVAKTAIAFEVAAGVPEPAPAMGVFIQLDESQPVGGSVENGEVVYVAGMDIDHAGEASRPLVVMQCSGGVMELTFTKPGHGEPYVLEIDWDNIKAGDADCIPEIPLWVEQYLGELPAGHELLGDLAKAGAKAEEEADMATCSSCSDQYSNDELVDGLCPNCIPTPTKYRVVLDVTLNSNEAQPGGFSPPHEWEYNHLLDLSGTDCAELVSCDEVEKESDDEDEF